MNFKLINVWCEMDRFKFNFCLLHIHVCCTMYMFSILSMNTEMIVHVFSKMNEGVDQIISIYFYLNQGMDGLGSHKKDQQQYVRLTGSKIFRLDSKVWMHIGKVWEVLLLWSLSQRQLLLQLRSITRLGSRFKICSVGQKSVLLIGSGSSHVKFLFFNPWEI